MTDRHDALPVVAWQDCFGDPWKRREDAMQDAESQPEPLVRADAAQAQIDALRAEVKALRRDLCAVRCPMAYMDDGEAQDNSVFPFIDYLRDPLPVIQQKLLDRARAAIDAAKENT